MPITLKCYATLARRQPADAARLPIEAEETVRSLMQRLGIPEDQVAIIMLNGKSVEPDATLADGDRLGLFPAVGGG
ncbi:MAG: MoaD/ThiS family protein [Thermodesulfobacteriota bacterium]